MNRDRRAARIATAVALALLLPACASSPAPERAARTWSYVGTPLPPYWWAALVDIGGARARGATGADRRIAILDTGLAAGQEDFANVAAGSATCGSDSADTADRNGHGTQLAGIAAGRDPGRVTRGVAPAAQIIPIRVSCGLVTADALARGLDRAIAAKADVVLLAIGGYPAGPPDVAAILRERIAASPDILFVVASVWDGAVSPLPGWTRLDNVLVVAAMTLDDTRGEVRFGSRVGDVWAPGRDVETADIAPDGAPPGRRTPYMMQGTSAASAIAAGCAALVREKAAGQTGARVKAALIQAAEPKAGLGAVDSRRLNCGKAIP